MHSIHCCCRLARPQAGASFITLHPRTKRQIYEGLADWDLTARARQLLRIPVIGNGDVISVAHAKALLQRTNCDGIMIGRGAVQVQRPSSRGFACRFC